MEGKRRGIGKTRYPAADAYTRFLSSLKVIMMKNAAQRKNLTFFQSINKGEKQ